MKQFVRTFYHDKDDQIDEIINNTSINDNTTIITSIIKLDAHGINSPKLFITFTTFTKEELNTFLSSGGFNKNGISF